MRDAAVLRRKHKLAQAHVGPDAVVIAPHRRGRRMQGEALGPGDCVRSGGRWQLQHPVLGLIAGHRLKGFGAPLLVVERQLQMNLEMNRPVYYTSVHSQSRITACCAS